MKIVTLNARQVRMWHRNTAVLAYADTGEAVMEEGVPRTPKPEEVVALLKASKKQKLFSVDVEGREAYFVRGRDFLQREFARAHNSPVQLRSPTGHILCNYRPKFQGHDLLKSACRPVETARGLPEPATVPGIAAPKRGLITVTANVPEPEDCPDCSGFSKPIGCRQDEHHFVCRHHDAYEKIRKARLAYKAAQDAKAVKEVEPSESAPTVTDTTKTEMRPPPDDVLMLIDLSDGEALRQATAEEIAESLEAVETRGMPMITIAGVDYGVASTDLVPAGDNDR